MHGVGRKVLQQLFQATGLPEPILVEEQSEPDGNFPTLVFPNPEEPGALDLSFARAERAVADLIIANDPDADRLAIAIPEDGRWRRLTGDELGLLLGAEVAERAAQTGRRGTLACSIVSGSALAAVAKQNGLDYRETLTGFKWISKVPALIFGYEEALGYCINPEQVPDKDGISAAALAVVIAARLKAEGSSIPERLDALGRRYGYFSTGQISIRVTDLSLIQRTMQHLRVHPPLKLAGAATSPARQRAATSRPWHIWATWVPTASFTG